MQIWRRLLLALFVMSCLIITGAILALALMIEAAPTQRTDTVIDSHSAKRVASLSRELKRQLSYNRQDVEIVADQYQLNALLAIAKKANFKLSGAINVSAQGLYLELSKELPTNILGNYLNLSLLILPSSNKLDIAYVKLGQLELPGPLLLLVIDKFFAIMASDIWWSSEVFEQIRSVKFSSNQMRITYHLTAQTKATAKQLLKRLSSYQSKQSPDLNSELIGYYYQNLIDTTDNIARAPVSLARYIGPLFRLAAQRSQKNSPKAENRAALAALTLYFTNSHFDYLIGNVLTPDMKRHRRDQSATLALRRDLQRHFVYSAAIELFSTTEISQLIGELKELLDSNKGGSGFSFVDLLADRAGIQFVKHATSTDVSARQLQAIISRNFDESRLFPPINNLQEGLSNSEFESQYKAINAAEYQELLATIDRRLMTLPIYRLKQK